MFLLQLCLKLIASEEKMEKNYPLDPLVDINVYFFRIQTSHMNCLQTFNKIHVRERRYC